MSEARTYYYASPDKDDPYMDDQIDTFRQLGAEEKYIFSEQRSDDERENYFFLRNSILCSGDTLVVKSLDKLAASHDEIRKELKFYIQHNIRLKILDLPSTMTDSGDGNGVFVNSIILEVMSFVGEPEPKKYPERMKYPVPDNWDEVVCRYINHKIDAREAINLLGGMGLYAFRRRVKRYKEDTGNMKWSIPEE